MQNTRALRTHLVERLKGINNQHGAKKPFLEKARINPRTFTKLIEKGYSTAAVVARVEDALREADSSPEGIVLHVKTYWDKLIEQIEGRPVKSKEERNRNEIYGRQLRKSLNLVCAFVLWKKTRLTLEEIAGVIGYADKSGPDKGIKRLENLLYIDRNMNDMVWTVIGTL